MNITDWNLYCIGYQRYPLFMNKLLILLSKDTNEKSADEPRLEISYDL